VLYANYQGNFAQWLKTQVQHNLTPNGLNLKSASVRIFRRPVLSQLVFVSTLWCDFPFPITFNSVPSRPCQISCVCLQWGLEYSYNI